MSPLIQSPGADSALRVVAPPLSRKACAYCATPLDIHQAARGAACSAPACQKQHVLALAAQRRRTEVADAWRAASGFRARVAPALGVADPESLPLAIVPHFQSPVVNLPRARRAEFRAHLVRVVRQAFEEKLTEPDVSALAEELSQAVRPSAEIPEAGGACATCRGFCCRTGGTHAYLNAAVVRSYLARHPGLRWPAVVRLFLQQLPDRSFASSCVYHGRGGCGLPREMRSGVCNLYQCEGLKGLREVLAASGDRPILVVAASRSEIGGASLVSRAESVVRVQKIPRA